ncbi:MAG: DUF5615 family PIN-like protein [Chloroflexi bacterium]|nr:DUF5615 family PIN-like protein [Chloroflexota bacterium]
MPGLGIRLFADEMVNPRVASVLARMGYDIESCQWAGRANQWISDESQLQYATDQGRAILTFNVGDFLRLDQRWKTLGRRHAGIVVAEQVLPLPELIRRVQLHLDSVHPETQENAVLELAR